eukprot:gnl/TRDRNA2_/TRDRNA2_64678_c0_seq1.p1 gnl/TRDRNA2_/TRDRNA2_64678_c0~~gnl/TRDRNA2_/TRDRNA2_64678_c0_seq1.p1  ORF type:complete len:631 (-),score=132.95 gnl/TRDRNA2_/TRDRNA2_64678_c0_seq1:226-2031(-)
MCGILAILGLADAETYRRRALELQKLLRHRGPDWSGIYCKGKNIVCHERLGIVDPDSGDQPLYARDDDSLILAVNGEIYNHKELMKEHGLTGKMRTGSDCEPLMHLYEKDGLEFLSKNEVCGMFALVLLDEKTQDFVVARDHCGIIPLYYGNGKDGSFWISSEMKCMVDDCSFFKPFPPGHIYDSKTQTFTPFLKRESVARPSKFYVSDDKALDTYPPMPTEQITLKALRQAFEQSVRSHLMSDVPYGVLLSGGLDSSLVAAIMAKNCRRRIEAEGTEEAFYPRLHSFCIGLKDSTDLRAAKQVADFLDTVHHAYVFTVQQGIDALSDVIYHIETFDVTTIRASTPMYLMARKIRATGVKMVLSGEGSDEIFGGYLYFHKAPNEKEFHEETVRKVSQLHMYDCLRANKSMMAWSIEARVPFLDKRFLETAFSFDPKQKMCRDETTGEPRCEKYILRKAFDLEGGEAYLPKDVLWRQKEQFSDGVGYSWIDAIQAHAEKTITDQQLQTAKFRFPEKTPKTKEAYLYREIFSKHFGESNVSSIGTVAWQDSIACSSETALRWDASFRGRADASGRSVAGVHTAAYEAKRFDNGDSPLKKQKVN